MPAETFLHGARTAWAAAPREVREWVSERVGEPVDPPQDCVGGMATGVAAVVHTPRAAVFVKALDEVDNPKGSQMYRAEARVARDLPRHASIPALLHSGAVEFDGARWWVNVFEAALGSTPQHPWSRADLDHVLAAWAQLRPALGSTRWTESAALSRLLTGWGEIAQNPTDPWHPLARHWVGREAAVADAIDGGPDAVLSHADLRSDNILLDAPSGRVSFVDWAHPGTAAPWADVALLLAEVAASGAATELGGEIDVLDVFARTEPGTDVECAITVISALGAFLHTRADIGRSGPPLPHRRVWMTALSQRLLPFIEAHTR